MSKLTLSEAIKHCLEVAEENDLAAGTYEILAENNHNAYERLTAETNSSRCAECAADHRQLAEWLMDYKELKNSIGAIKLSNMTEALKLIREYKAENIAQKKMIAEYKQLLKAAVDDFAFVSENFINNMDSFCSMYNHISGCAKGCPMSGSDDYGRCKWRYADEALKLLNNEK